MVKLQLPEGAFPNTAIGMLKSNSRCIAVPSVAKVPYMEYFACRSCMLQLKRLELTFTHFLQEGLLIVTHEPCTQNECFHQTHLFSNRKCIQHRHSLHANSTDYTWYEMFVCIRVLV